MRGKFACLIALVCVGCSCIGVVNTPTVYPYPSGWDEQDRPQSCAPIQGRFEYDASRAEPTLATRRALDNLNANVFWRNEVFEGRISPDEVDLRGFQDGVLAVSYRSSGIENALFRVQAECDSAHRIVVTNSRSGCGEGSCTDAKTTVALSMTKKGNLVASVVYVDRECPAESFSRWYLFLRKN